MRPRGNRLLHVLLSAPAAVLLTVASTPITHAQAAQATTPPKPYVIVIDPGHGGSPDNNHPNQLFDPGAIGVNGVLEKDVTLDISKRLATLLKAYHVDAQLTRTTDVYMSIDARSNFAIAKKADLFVSVHEDSYTDGSATGSLVLYPNNSDLNYATDLANSVGQAEASSGITNVGTRLDDNWWIHLPMPAAVVESAYLSNPQEAALLATAPFRQTVAQGIFNGLLTYLPAIKSRSAQIDTANAAEAAAAAATAELVKPNRHAISGGGGSPLMWIFAITFGFLGFRYRQVWVPTAAEIVERGFSFTRRNRHRLELRRRRASVRARVLEGRARPLITRPIRRARSVYDELTF
jgi:N-acetylmuramoyl-L-alanine amidase